jgi:hypothetical protein
MNTFECVQVNHHKDIGEMIMKYQASGWRLHTYQAAGLGSDSVRHYLLFERDH